MSQSTATRPMTAAEFMALPDDGRRIELWEGAVVEMAPTGEGHGVYTAELAGSLAVYLRRRGVGRVVAGDAAVIVQREPDSVLAPDVAVFVDRPRDQPPRPGAAVDVPQIVAEIASPSDRPRQLRTKAQRWLGAGVQEVWIVWPEERSIEILPAGSEPRTVMHPDTLTCDLLPGFELPLAELFGP